MSVRGNFLLFSAEGHLCPEGLAQQVERRLFINETQIDQILLGVLLLMLYKRRLQVLR